MSAHKFTDDEIIHSLKVCSTDGDCSECRINPHKGNYGYCTSLAIKAALDLINRQKAEIESLNSVHADMTESLRLAAEANKDMSVELDSMRGAANSYKMHYEEAERKYKIAVAEREANVRGFAETLQKIAAEQASRVVEAMDEIKVVAIKEFAQRLVAIYENDKTYDRPNAHTLVVTVFRNIDTLVKEMTETK